MSEEQEEAVCCVCGHHLGTHIDEGDGWRCHSLGEDGYQCECYLRKRGDRDIRFYSLERRISENAELLK